MNVSLGYTPKYDTRFMVWITIRLRIHKQLVERTHQLEVHLFSGNRLKVTLCEVLQLKCTLAGTKVYVSSMEVLFLGFFWLVFSKCICSIVGVDILVLLKGL